MRKPEYLSPSSLACFEEKPEEFYMRYLADVKPPKIAQTPAMAVGSAFDAYVKSYLHGALFGLQAKDSEKYAFTNLFENQVEKQNRDEAIVAGRHCFEAYKESGALADLMLELQGAVDEPRFEFDLMGEVNGEREGITKGNFGVILMGKPDLRFINAEGAHVIYDWKVNGYCGKGNTSPTKGYVKVREVHSEINRWYNAGKHKDAEIQRYKGIDLNIGCHLEDCSRDWATQLATYGWLMGEPVGAEIITGIDQIVGKANGKRPILRVASHRAKISENFQFETLARYQNLWGLIHSEPFYFFTNLSVEESQKKCQILDETSKMFGDPMLSKDDKWLLSMSRK